jgi:RNA polymerase sigma factor (sigma-70 family)
VTVRGSDAELLERFLTARDETAFAALVRRHGGLVLAACRRVLSDPADVEDAFQATFLILLRKAASIRRSQAVGGWLYRVAYRAALQVRTDAAHRHELADDMEPVARDSSDPSWREVCSLLYAELDRLPLKFRLPLILCYLDGKTRDEAAQQLGWSVGSVKGYLERGRKQLRARLERRGVALSAGLLTTLLAPRTQAITRGWWTPRCNRPFSPRQRRRESRRPAAPPCWPTESSRVCAPRNA